VKALRFHAAGDLRYEECPDPVIEAPGQVIVRPLACGICGTDISEYVDGPHWTRQAQPEHPRASEPQILGHEFSAEVVEAGPGCTMLQVGNRISCQPIVGPRNDYYGQRAMPLFSPDSSLVGLSWPWGGLADLAMLDEFNAVRIPDALTDAQGALIEPTAVAVQAVERSGLRPGDTVFVAGGGPIGALCAFAAQAAGASRVVMSQRSIGRRLMLKEIAAAEEVLDPSDEDFARKVRDVSPDGLGVNVAFETSGNPAALQQCIDVVRPMGTVVVAGVIHKGMTLHPMQWFAKGISIHATNGFPTHAWSRVIALIGAGKIPVDRLISRTVELANAVEEGFRPMAESNKGLMKVLVRQGVSAK
jgi:(R,R)-butanediol dehydrogenase/meso-butanediol dehydrogenase/diacetyl reductase